MTKLDTRPARCDLTSRECCKLISGALAGATATFTHADAAKLYFRVLFAAAAEDADGCRAAVAALDDLALNPHDALAMEAVSRIIGAVIGAVHEQAAPGALDDAIKWIGERGDDYWVALRQGMLAVPPVPPVEDT